MTGQNPEQIPSTIEGATRLAALQRSVEELDRELDELGRAVPAPRRDAPVDASSLARVDALLAALGAPAELADLTFSAPPARVDEAAPSADVPVAATAVAGADEATFLEPTGADDVATADATTTILTSEAPGPAFLSFPPAVEARGVEQAAPEGAPDEPREEDIPRRLLDFAEPAQGDALATIADMPDLDVEPPAAPSSAVETLLAAPEGVAPPGAQSSLPMLDEPLFLSEPPALPIADFALDAAPELKVADAEAPAPELGAAVESMLIDEDEVVVEAAASTPPGAGAEASTTPDADAQVVVDTDDVLVMEPPAAATGTLLGLAPAARPSSRAPGGSLDGDLGEIVFNLEPELEVAKPPTAAPRPVIVPSASRPRDSVVGASGSKPPPRARDSLDNLELDLSELMPGEARPPSLRPPPLLRQPPPPPQGRSAPPPVPRASKPRVEAEEIVELDEQEVEVLRASSRPPPAGESKAPPPVPQRPGGQK